MGDQMEMFKPAARRPLPAGLHWIPDPMGGAGDEIAWLERDTDTFPLIVKELRAELFPILSRVPHRGTMIQAGGNMGLWARAFCPMFDEFLTFEPDPELFACLKINLAESFTATGRRPRLYRHGLDTDVGAGAVDRWLWPHNPGATRLSVGGGDVPLMPIDALQLERLDLLQLDIEGMEGRALLGGEATIRKFRPTIVLELRDHGGRYGWTDDAVRGLLATWGYERSTRIEHDEIFTPTKRAGN